jgi:hypothetical protein
MTLQQLVEKLTQYPSYLKKGSSFLANQFNVDVELVHQAKSQVREILKKEIMKDFKQETMSFNDFAKMIGITIDEEPTEEPELDIDWGGIRTSNKNQVSKKDLKVTAQSLMDELEESEWEEKVKWVKTDGKSTLMVKKKSATGIDYQKEFELFLDNTFKNRQFDWKYEEKKINLNPDLCLVLCLFDVHIGRESYKHYTGDDNDLQSQQEEFVTAINKLVKNINFNQLDKIILPIGNDFFNVDTPTLTTTKGTPQDNIKDLHSMFYTGLNLLSEVAIYLSSLAPVELMLVPGNHDTVTSSYLATSLKVIFRDNERISVDDSPISRKYRQYGKTTLGFAHGDLKMEKYAELLPYEAKEMFATSEWYEFLLGDKHHEKMIQKEDGVVVRHLGGMTKADVWTYHNGYTTSKRRAYGILYQKDQGRIMEIIHQL